MTNVSESAVNGSGVRQLLPFADSEHAVDWPQKKLVATGNKHGDSCNDKNNRTDKDGYECQQFLA